MSIELKKANEYEALHGVSCEISDGEMVAIIGLYIFIILSSFIIIMPLLFIYHQDLIWCISSHYNARYQK
jgi:ABC-type histidine transport system ATPase subunit